MKVLTGLIGLVIFAISLPSASETGDDVRVNFFNKFYPQPACPITDDQKITIIQSIEKSNNITLNWTNYSSSSVDSIKKTLVENGMRNLMSGHCTEAGKSAAIKFAADSANLKAIQDATAAQNARIVAQTQAAAIATRKLGGNSVAPGGSNADLITAIGGLSAGQRAANESDKAKASIGAEGGGKAPKAAAATDRGSLVSGDQSGGNAKAVKVDTEAPIVIAQNAMINSSDGTVKLGDGSVYTFDKTSKTFKSPGKDSLDYDGMLNASGCKPSDSECADALTYASKIPEAAQLAKGAASSSGANSLDSSTTGQIAQMESQIDAMKKEAEAAANHAQGTVCASLAGVTMQAIEAYGAAAKSCHRNAAISDNLCSLVRSPKAILVQKLMSVGTIIINRQSSASDNCSAAQKFSRLAQQGLTIANVACTGVKLICDTTCATAQSTWAALEAANASLLKCGTALIAHGTKLEAAIATAAAGAEFIKQGMVVEQAGQTIQPMVMEQKPIPPAKIVQCEKYEADIANMALQILSVTDAGKQASACKKALGESGGSGGGSKTNPISMDEFCKVPGQAANPPCLCRTQPTATGCPGALTTTTTTVAASNVANGGGVRTGSTGGSSAMAAPGALTGMQGGSKTSLLSKEAKAALGISDNGSTLAAGDGTSAASGIGGAAAGGVDASGSSGGGSGSLAKSPSELAKKAEANKKGGPGYGFDDFSLGGFGNLKWGADGKTTINGKKYSQEEIQAMVERKIASEEFHTQVTTASGKSNWDKVRVRYDENRSSLYP